MGEAVLVADVPKEARFFDVFAQDGEREDRRGEGAAGLEHGFQLVRTQALAALNADGIGQDHVDEFDVGVLLQKRVEFVLFWIKHSGISSITSHNATTRRSTSAAVVSGHIRIIL